MSQANVSTYDTIIGDIPVTGIVSVDEDTDEVSFDIINADIVMKRLKCAKHLLKMSLFLFELAMAANIETTDQLGIHQNPFYKQGFDDGIERAASINGNFTGRIIRGLTSEDEEE